MRASLTLLACLLAVPAAALRHVKDAEVQPRLNGTSFSNVILVVHCRPPMHLAKEARTLCKERASLYEPYKKHFAKVIYLTHRECPPSATDVYNCTAPIMQTHEGFDGLMYARADTLISTSHLSKSFDKNVMASYSEDRQCALERDMKFKNCTWVAWTPKMAELYQKAMTAIGADPKFRLPKNPRDVFLGNSELYYIPSKLFKLYRPAARLFASYGVHHQVAGPTIRAILGARTRTQRVSLDCTSTCCTGSTPTIQVNESFTCGHASDLDDSFKEASHAILTRVARPNAPIFGFLPDMAVGKMLIDAMTQ